ncbi:hypothetical protein PYCCODRAFT_1429249 [Trametes coccinea BRFM310]|uniref:Uncharacterized protein n=1 Tax=Trametes coccinea (strain BRFM310) TaxID=1353009 RepID=A0A1Y2I4X3_TRAC3|nr:hypothetical protein PYCCODRAFT_1429249 [Trametes coccinea BRFM310]
MVLILSTQGWVWRIGTPVFFIAAGKCYCGIIVGNEVLEGLRLGYIKLNDGSPKPVLLPYSAFHPSLRGLEVAWAAVGEKAADNATIWRWNFDGLLVRTTLSHWCKLGTLLVRLLVHFATRQHAPRKPYDENPSLRKFCESDLSGRSDTHSLTTLGRITAAFDATVCRKIPTLFAPMLVPLPAQYPMAALLNLYSGLMHIVPPSVIGPVESSGVPLFVHFPTCPPTRETPWVLSDRTGKVQFKLHTPVSLPILGEGKAVAIKEVSIEGWSLLTIQTKGARDTIYVLVPTESTRRVDYLLDVTPIPPKPVWLHLKHVASFQSPSLNPISLSMDLNSDDRIEYGHDFRLAVSG